MRLFMHNMKITNSLVNRSRTVCLTLFTSAVLLPLSLLFAQATQGDYIGVDISNTVTAGPVINVKQITRANSSSDEQRHAVFRQLRVFKE